MQQNPITGISYVTEAFSRAAKNKNNLKLVSEMKY
jgi:hypothetical protein